MESEKFPRPIRSILGARRALRLKMALKSVKTWPGMKVLDIGCGCDGRSFSDHVDKSWRITGIDILSSVDQAHPGFVYIRGDARDLSRFPTKSFDLVVCIGMLEHITPPQDYRAACSEMQRVAKQLAVMVPFKWAPIEPHYGFPFFGALPQRLQIALVKTMNLCGHRNHIDHFMTGYKWRTNAQYRRDFSGSVIKLSPTLDSIWIIRSV